MSNGTAQFVGMLHEREGGTLQLVSSPAPESHDSCLILFRGFIANRSELVASLFANDRPSKVSDPWLLIRAYHRWGPALQQRVAGEYCAAIFDESSRELLLTNDALGCLPVFHTIGRSPFSFASHLNLLAEAISSNALDERYIADFLLFGLHFGARTVHASIRRVCGGHSIRWASGRITDVKTWSLANVVPLSYASESDYDEHFRELLREAITTATEGNTWAELSGGLDTSSIVSMAVQAGISALELISIVYGRSKTADERKWMAEILRQYPLRWHVLDGDELHPFLGFPDRTLPEPCRGGLVWKCVEQYERLARENDVKVILSGFGGDQILFASPRPIYLSDLLKRGQVTRTLRELRAWQTGARQRRPMMHFFFRDVLEPIVSYHLNRSIDHKPIGPFPVPWLSKPWLDRLGIDKTYRLLTPTPKLPSIGDQFFYERLWQVFAFAGQRWTQLTTAFEVRHPLLYRPLVEFMHALPWEQKIRPGYDRLLQRRALSGVLPEAVRTRRDKAGADESFFEGLRRSKEWASLLTDRPLIVEHGYADGRLWNDAVRLAQLGIVQRGGIPSFLSAAELELWLRQLEQGVTHNGSLGG